MRIGNNSQGIWQFLSNKSFPFAGKQGKEQAYHAFMDAVSGRNSGRLKQEKGSLNQFRLDLGISSSVRNALNGIWDYYANL